jgi:transcriptional regulator with XRE-family HTH domain
MTPAELQSWRHRTGLSQPGLAALLGLHPLTISKYERGERAIHPLMPLALYALDHGYTKSSGLGIASKRATAAATACV